MRDDDCDQDYEYEERQTANGAPLRAAFS